MEPADRERTPQHITEHPPTHHPLNRPHCCFCQHFQLEGYRWGYCDLLDVYVRGDLESCRVAILPFSIPTDPTQEIDEEEDP